MKIAVTGHKGRVGSELVRRGYTPLMADSGDITNLEEVDDDISRENPDVIIHCAAKTNVAWCEENEMKAFGVNVRGTANLLHDFHGTLIYLSTVHVFDGRKYFKYSERHDPNPINAYGLTKWAGEAISLYGTARSIIVRTSSLFDWGNLHGQIDFHRAGNDANYTTLIKRSFVHTSHFVDGLMWLIDRLDEYPKLGLLHIAGTDMISYYDFWLQIANTLGFDNKLVIPRKHKIDEHPRPFRGGLSIRKAKRMGMPLFSSIDGLKLIKENMK